MQDLFEVAWKSASKIPGWLSPNEGRLLFDSAKKIPFGIILEVGSYLGKSAVLLAHTGYPVHTIDPMVPGVYPANKMSIHDDDATRLSKNVGQYPNINWTRMYSEHVRPDGEIGLLYIDGSHILWQPYWDFMHFLRWCREGTTVAFHDYGTYKAVNECVDRLVDDGYITKPEVAGSMAVSTVIKAAPIVQRRIVTQVTGICIAVLCHNFGNRGRLFCKSLCEQQLLNVPIHLQIFYANEQDKYMCMEGLRDTNRFTCTFICTSLDEVMKRGKLFNSQADIWKASRLYSHVLFTDADLWFPPEFFSRYVCALERKPKGYWGTWVQDIRETDANHLIKLWGQVDERTMRKYGRGIRYDASKGKCGHFQCVPKELAVYPTSEECTVSGLDDDFSRWAIQNSDDPCTVDRRIGFEVAYHLDHAFSWYGSKVLL